MKLLAFETATEACSVALWVDGQVRERHEVAPRRHAELSLPWADALLAEAGLARSQLDVLAVSRGPGAFTGVRLGISLVQGIALALDRPVVAVSTLAVLAAAVPGGNAAHVLASIDARMGEVYAGAFVVRDADVAAVGPETVGPAVSVALPESSGRWHGVGTGFAAGDGALASRFASQLGQVDATALPHAADLARLAARAAERGEGLAPERIEPAYLRNQVALTLVEQQALRSGKER